MSVTLTMVDVVILVPTLSVALSVHVILDMSWTLMMRAPVWVSSINVYSVALNTKVEISYYYMQTSMSVPLVMEGVVVPVSTLLVATTVHVPQNAHWTPMVMLAMVSCIILPMYILHTLQ